MGAEAQTKALQTVIPCPMCNKPISHAWVERWRFVAVHVDGTHCEKGRIVNEPSGVFDNLLGEEQVA